MRYVLFLGVLLLAAPVFAFNDSTVSYCATTPQPQHCVSSFLTFEQYYAVEYGQFLAAIENDPLNTMLPPAKTDELARVFCEPPRLTAHCRDTLAAFTPYAVGFMKWHDQKEQLAQQRDIQQRQIDAQLAMQQRMIDAQLEQARLQANGMALFGTGQALINGMNQGFQNMQQPRYTPFPFVPIAPMNPVQPTIRCYSTNPGAMQTTTCY
jgi:hypothetical protein